MNVKTLHTIIQNILLFLAVALLPAALPAQKLQITEATAAMEPMTVPMQRLDFNNQICALVKVVLPVAGVQFEGNVVGEPVFKTSEYWVYLTPGTKMLKIKAPGHYPVMADFRTLGVGPLESKTIYYVTLEAEGSGPVKPAMETNYAVLTVQPPTATVKIDGQPQPVEDGSVIVLLKLGEHTWQAEAVGYASDSGTFRITPTDKTNVSVQLKSQKATLTVNTVADATVYINGRQQGSGNRTLELLPGIYNVELRRQGYKPYTQTVELQASQTAQVSCTEFTPVYGMLSVNYRPVGSTITLNGRQIGTTPANLNDVNIGTYTLAISAPNYITHTQPVTITETTPVTLSGSLQKQPSATAPVPPTSTNSNNDFTTPSSSSNSSNNVFTSVEEQPQFPGGEAGLASYISKNLHYPKIAQENGIQGRVVVKFVVTKTGSIGEVIVLKSVDPSLDNEAIRLVKSLPKFIPGKNNGYPVNVWYALPLNFKLSQ